MLGFKDQNPLSKVSMIITCRQKAIVLGDFEKSIEQVMEALQKYDDFEGMPSMQQALEFARIQVDKCVPDYALKEVLVINSSITICDPGDILETVESLRRSNVLVSVFSLSAAIHILKKLASDTGGMFYLPRNKENFSELMMSYLVPQY